jgi:hypothetical protein
LTYDAGSARATYTISLADFEKQIARAKQLYADLAKAAAIKPPPLPAAALSSSAGATTNANAQKRALDALRNSEIAAARAAGDHAGALKLIEAELGRASQGTVRYNQLLAQQSRAQAAAARAGGGLGTAGGLPILPRTVENFGTAAIDQFKSGLLGIVGPAAVAGASIAAISATVESFKRAFTFKAELDATNLAIRTNLEGVRDSSAVFQEAAKFADKYRLTQKETADILTSSTDILRVSTASVGDLESALLRLQSRDVSKPISEAARALRELNSGDVTSIKELFNVPAREALRMKNEIANGGDAVLVLNGYLERAGVGMGVLENRAKGAAGAMNEQRIAQENLVIAQAKIASSAGGIFFVQGLTRQYQGLANLLNGDALAGLQATGRELQISAAGALAYAAATAQGKSAAEAQAIADQASAAAANSFADAQRNGGGGTFELVDALKQSDDALSKDAVDKLASTIKTAELAFQQSQLEADSLAAVNGLLGAGDQALIMAKKYGIATEQAQFLIDAQARIGAAAGLAEQRAGERAPGASGSAERNAVDELRAQRTFARLGQPEKDRQAAKAKQDAEALAASQARLEESTAITAAQKIALAKRRLNATTNEADRNDAQANLNTLLAQQSKVSKTGTSKGISVLDQDQIQAGENLRDQLATVNQLLEKQNLTAHQRNDLLEKRRKLEEQITDEINRQAEASIDAQLGIVQDAQKRLKEAREVAGLQKKIDSGSLSDRNAQSAGLRIQEITLLQQQRAMEIQKDQRQAGGVTTPLPLSNVATLPPVQPPGAQGRAAAALPAAQPGVVTLRLVDTAGRTLAETVEPIIIADLRVAFAQSQSAGA